VLRSKFVYLRCEGVVDGSCKLMASCIEAVRRFSWQRLLQPRCIDHQIPIGGRAYWLPPGASAGREVKRRIDVVGIFSNPIALHRFSSCVS